jgi:hypothetical protein
MIRLNFKLRYSKYVSCLFLSLVFASCVETVNKQNVPELFKTEFKTEKVYHYNIDEFAAFLLGNFDRGMDAGYFLRQPDLYVQWDSPDDPIDIFSYKISPNNRYYNTQVHLSNSQSKELILSEDYNLNIVPKQFFLQLEEGGFVSRAEGYPILSLSMDYELFEAVIRAFIKRSQGNIKIKDPYFDDYQFSSNDFIKNGFLIGEKRGFIEHPNFGKINLVFSLSCGNGRGVGCYGDGTFIFKPEEPVQ